MGEANGALLSGRAEEVWECALRWLISDGVRRDDLDGDQTGTVLPGGLSFSVAPFERTLLSTNVLQVHYPAATFEWLQLQLGLPAADSVPAMRHYGGFMPGVSLPGGRPWRPLLEESVTDIEEAFTRTLTVDTESFVHVGYPEPDPCFSLSSAHGLVWPQGLEVVLHWRTMDMFREYPYILYAWGLWHQYLALKTGHEAWRVRHVVSKPYLKHEDAHVLASIKHLSSHAGPVLKGEPDWQLVLDCERHLRLYGTDDFGTLGDDWSWLGEILSFRAHRNRNELSEMWRSVIA